MPAVNPVADELLLQAGPFQARIANSAEEILGAQQLRYQVMYVDSGGQPDPDKARRQADIDEWDERASHVVVIDQRCDNLKVVGTLRMMSNRALGSQQDFYTGKSFDLTKLRNHYSHAMEIGRFCVDPSSRSGVVLGLIWKFAAQYLVDQEVDVMFGCASFPGADITKHKESLVALYNHSLAPPELRVPAIVPHHNIGEFRDDIEIEGQATRRMPPLVRGYLSIGAKINDCAIVDPIFNTTFVCIYVDVEGMMKSNALLKPR